MNAYTKGALNDNILYWSRRTQQQYRTGNRKEQQNSAKIQGANQHRRLSNVLDSLKGEKHLAIEEGPMAGWLYRNLSKKG